MGMLKKHLIWYFLKQGVTIIRHRQPYRFCPRQRQLIGEQVYYPREAFVAYLENKGVRIIDVPEM